ncbi:MAG: ATP-binding cassette domain-containing protein [Rickettsiales bacterium]|nr:ATP-binding cassette domain-containing protein [Rickettsiales bacterium]
MQDLITLSNINLAPNGNKEPILENISFAIKQNDFITIVGPNGAGKTSLLKIILGLIKPSLGNIARHKNLAIGYLPQKMHIPQTIPINVEYFLKLNQDVKPDLFEEIIANIKIEPLLTHKLYNLSGGETQKVFLAKALLSQPNLLILDEPAQNLDISGQIEFYELINKIYCKKQTSILMVSHDLHMVMASTKKVICLFKHICCQGAPQTVAEDPKFISIFGDNMSKLMSIYNHYHNHKHG